MLLLPPPRPCCISCRRCCCRHVAALPPPGPAAPAAAPAERARPAAARPRAPAHLSRRRVRGQRARRGARDWHRQAQPAGAEHDDAVSVAQGRLQCLLAPPTVRCGACACVHCMQCMRACVLFARLCCERGITCISCMSFGACHVSAAADNRMLCLLPPLLRAQALVAPRVAAVGAAAAPGGA